MKRKRQKEITETLHYMDAIRRTQQAERKTDNVSASDNKRSSDSKVAGSCSLSCVPIKTQ